MHNAEANFDNVNAIHLESRTASVRSSGEEAENEGIKPVGGVPIGSNVLPVCLVILGRCLTRLVDKPEEEVNKDNIGFAEAPLLEGSTHLGQHGLKGDVGKCSVHCYNVCSRIFVLRMHCADCGATVVVNAHGVVGHGGYLRQERPQNVGVRFCGEESVDIARSCTEEQVHSSKGRRSLCLGTAAEAKKKFNQGLQRGNS
jgi:hypothetical protein